MLNEKLKVGIIFGGQSVEHDISILTALQVYHEIDKEKYQVIPFYITKNNEILTHKSLFDLETYKKGNFNKCKVVTFYNENHLLYYLDISKRRKIDYIDIFIPTVHGANIEDGTLSGYLDFLNVPYTSSDILSSSIAQDKIVTKYVLESLKIPTLPYVTLNKHTYNHNQLSKKLDEITLPIIIKPYNLGSSIGIKIAHTLEEAYQFIMESFKYSEKLLIEPALEQYREFNQSIYREISKYQISQIEEVSTNNELLTFTDKYINKQQNQSSRIIPADISNELKEQISEYTKKIYSSLSFKGIIRIDYLYDNLNNKIYVNEINTIPGSLAYYLYEISFTELIDKQIKNALYEQKQKLKYIKTFNSNVLFNKGEKLKK